MAPQGRAVRQSVLDFKETKKAKPGDQQGKQALHKEPGEAQTTRGRSADARPVRVSRSSSIPTVKDPIQPTTEEVSMQLSRRAPAPTGQKGAAAQKQSRHVLAQTTGDVSPRKVGKRSQGAQPSKKGPGAVRYFDRYEFNSDEFMTGGDAYVIITSDLMQLPDNTAEDACVTCNKSHKSHTIIECECCLGGFHMGCLHPPLKAVPKGIWLCPDCVRGVPAGSTRKLNHAYQKFLFTPSQSQVLGLVHIRGFVENRIGNGKMEVVCRYYCRPEETYLSRQPHHAAREVFITPEEHYEPVECLFMPATVCAPKAFDEMEGVDVFSCEYEYDAKWKRFRRRHYPHGGRIALGGASEDEDDSDYQAEIDGVDSDDSVQYVKDKTFKPIHAVWAERGMLPGGFKGRTPGPRKGLNRQAELALEGPADAGGLLEMVGGGVGSVPERGAQGALANSRHSLALSAPPAVLPCRDSEKQQLQQFVQGAITEEGGSGPGVLYVCGVPGTGKTACIQEVLGAARLQALARGVQLVIINALSLPSPAHVYSKLWEKLTGQHVGPAKALANLEALFSAQQPQLGGAGGSSKPSKASTQPTPWSMVKGNRNGRACMTLLVVDEIDILITKDQSVLYNLFEWPTRPGARLAVIGISNTHDLDERVLPRISSRLASAKLVFTPYTATQLTTIVEQRLTDSGCAGLFKPVAVTWAVRKVASSSGDVRRALELLRRAIELVEAAHRKEGRPALGPTDPAAQGCITEQHVKVAVQEMFGSPHVQCLRACGRLEKLALVGLLLELRATSKPDTSVQAIHARMQNHVGLLVPDARCDTNALCRALFNMASKQLLVTSPSWQGLKARVSLNVHKDDICNAIKEEASLTAVHGQLS